MESDEREEGGRGERGGEDEKRTWRSNLSCFQTVIYDNKILSFLLYTVPYRTIYTVLTEEIDQTFDNSTIIFIE